MAIGFKKRNQNRRVYVLLGDGECNEGSVWESAASASELEVDNLTAILDENGFRNDGANTTYAETCQLADVWSSFGWNVLHIDGHDYNDILEAMKTAQNTKGRPSIIVSRTIKGKGISFMENNNDWHHNRITKNGLYDCLQSLGFEVEHD